jgi:hypothetical protein
MAVGCADSIVISKDHSQDTLYPALANQNIPNWSKNQPL